MRTREGGQRRWGELESEVLASLWASDVPLTAAQVLDELGDPELAYKTVLTVLTRLHDKGVLTREKLGRAHAYRPAGDGVAAAVDEFSAALRGGAERVAVLRRFLDTLDPADERSLRSLLRQRDERS
ncbi:MAG: BlaI/MecI/CopY family transcriptional regulator [Pseudonocardiales bacterium]|nr:BlaI/MecI/CopY family transcriptional regulator [Pseudonocardiales bacterium]